MTRRITMVEYHLRIKELPPTEQPRERLRDQGPAALSDGELLAILLRVGVAGTNVVQLLMLEMSHLEQEHLRAVLLDTKNRVQTVATIYIGSLNSSLIRVGEVFRDALKHNSAALIIAHNHPSGDPTPSPEDVLVTREIVSAGQLLDVEVLDHLVIGQGRFVSMRERGLGFAK